MLEQKGSQQTWQLSENLGNECFLHRGVMLSPGVAKAAVQTGPENSLTSSVLMQVFGLNGADGMKQDRTGMQKCLLWPLLHRANI